MEARKTICVIETKKDYGRKEKERRKERVKETVRAREEELGLRRSDR